MVSYEITGSIFEIRHTQTVGVTLSYFISTHTHIYILYAATPADVSLLMQLGVDGVFVGSGIFKSGNPEKRAKAMVQAVTHYKDPKVLAEVSEDLGDPMVCL